MRTAIKVTYSVALLAGAAVAGLWWLGRKSLMEKRNMQIGAMLALTNEPPPDGSAAAAPASPPPTPAALPNG